MAAKPAWPSGKHVPSPTGLPELPMPASHRSGRVAGLSAFALGCLCVSATVAFEPLELPNPFPRHVAMGESLQSWNFFDSTSGWRAANQCQLSVADNALHVQCTGHDPYLIADLKLPGGLLVLRLRGKCSTAGDGQLFWSTDRQPGFAEGNSRHFELNHDGGSHEYYVPFEVMGELRALRLDPGTAAGSVVLNWLAVHRGVREAVEIAAISQQEQTATVYLKNHSDQAATVRVNDQPLTLTARAVESVAVRLPGQAPVEPFALNVLADTPTRLRTIWVVRPQVAFDHVTRSRGPVTLEVARDGSLARLLWNGQLVAVLAPLVHVDDGLPQEGLPRLTLAPSEDGPLSFTGEGLTVKLELTAVGEVAISIRSEKPAEGPVVRVMGEMEQGLFAGLEYLERGEHSSSKLDIETDESLRFDPDPMKVTLPLMAFVTDRGAVSMSWQDMTLQPTFASPNFVDGTTDQRLSLRGTTIEAVLRLGPAWGQGGRIEDAILWAVKLRGLPPVPPAPRSFDAQLQLSLAAYQRLIRCEQGGWYHAVVPGGDAPGRWFADHASAIWRITGRAPQTPQLAYGGAHVGNSAAYFVTGRAAQWLQTVNDQARQLIRGQQSDGSYHYDGPYRRGHFEDTANGICARPALVLLEHAWSTGNPESLAAGVKTLEYMRRFRTPRGAQTWEVPLHTPDILASAYLVWAYVRGYELTGDKQWLDEARRWALSGLPFVYQWSNRPIMLYATTPVYGATSWKAPNWMGLPVQWCGTVYAYALLLFAPHDTTLDWHQVAEGILVAGEQMQYPDGPSQGCLPDVFHLASQQRRPADINPGALVSLRLCLAGKLDALAVAVEGNRRVVAPFPVTIRDGQTRIDAAAGTTYQVVLDGRRVVEVHSQGQDVIPLD